MHEWLHRCLNVIPFLNEHFLGYERWKESKEDILTLSHDIHATTKDLIPWRNSLTYYSGQSLAWQNSQHFAATQLVSLWNNVGSLLRLVIFLYHFLTLFFVNPTCQCWNKATMKRVTSFMWHWSLCCARWPCMLLLFKWELKTQGWGVVLKENLVRGMPPRLYNHLTLCKTKPVCFASLFKTGDLLWPGWPGWFISFAYRIKCYCLCFFFLTALNNNIITSF